MSTSGQEVPPWPPVGPKGIPTEDFLRSCDIVVQCFGALGTVLAPVKSDVEGNVIKLRKVYGTNHVKYEFLEDMIRYERTIKGSTAPDALLWLKRALHFICIMLESVVNVVKEDGEDPEIKPIYLSSYNDTLRKYHNWAIQKGFILCINSGLLPGCRGLLLAMPSCRSAPEGTATSDLAVRLKPFLDGLRSNLLAIITFYHAEGLDSVATL